MSLKEILRFGLPGINLGNSVNVSADTSCRSRQLFLGTRDNEECGVSPNGVDMEGSGCSGFVNPLDEPIIFVNLECIMKGVFAEAMEKIENFIGKNSPKKSGRDILWDMW